MAACLKAGFMPRSGQSGSSRGRGGAGSLPFQVPGWSGPPQRMLDPGSHRCSSFSLKIRHWSLDGGAQISPVFGWVPLGVPLWRGCRRLSANACAHHAPPWDCARWRRRRARMSTSPPPFSIAHSPAPTKPKDCVGAPSQPTPGPRKIHIPRFWPSISGRCAAICPAKLSSRARTRGAWRRSGWVSSQRSEA